MSVEAVSPGDKLEIREAEAASITEARRARLRLLNIPIDPLAEKVAEWPHARVNGRVRSRMVIEPADGRIPYTARAIQTADVWRRSGNVQGLSPADGPEARRLADRCLVLNGHAPMLFPHEPGGTRRIVQTLTNILIHTEAGGDARIIHMNEPPLPAGVTSRIGHSVGRWDGDTLVVETSGFPAAGFQIEMITAPPMQVGPGSRVIERFRPVSSSEILYQFTVEDPALYAAPWLAEYPVVRSSVVPREYACHEGSYAMANILRGAREMERRTADAASRRRSSP